MGQARAVGSAHAPASAFPRRPATHLPDQRAHTGREQAHKVLRKKDGGAKLQGKGREVGGRGVGVWAIHTTYWGVYMQAGGPWRARLGVVQCAWGQGPAEAERATRRDSLLQC